MKGKERDKIGRFSERTFGILCFCSALVVDSIKSLMKLSGASVVVFCRSRFEKENGEVVVALKNVTGADDV